jgi:hypothetical protein
MDSIQRLQRTLEREPFAGERVWRALQVGGIIVVAVGAAAAVGALVVRDQMARHRRQLFSSYPLRRLAALGYLSRREASVDTIRLLRDYIQWEPKPIIRRRAIQLLGRMEQQLAHLPPPPGEFAG